MAVYIRFAQDENGQPVASFGIEHQDVKTEYVVSAGKDGQPQITSRLKQEDTGRNYNINKHLDEIYGASELLNLPNSPSAKFLSGESLNAVYAYYDTVARAFVEPGDMKAVQEKAVQTLAEALAATVTPTVTEVKGKGLFPKTTTTSNEEQIKTAAGELAEKLAGKLDSLAIVAFDRQNEFSTLGVDYLLPPPTTAENIQDQPLIAALAKFLENNPDLKGKAVRTFSEPQLAELREALNAAGQPQPQAGV